LLQSLLPFPERFDLFDPFPVESAHALDLRSQVINLVVIADLKSESAFGSDDPSGGRRKIIAKHKIWGGRECAKRYSD
jgi:hypothetical protein